MSKAEKDEARKIATRRVRLGLLITEIGRDNIDVTEEDTRKAVFEETRTSVKNRWCWNIFRRIHKPCNRFLALFLRKVIDLSLKWPRCQSCNRKDTLYQADESDAVPTKKVAKKSAKKATSKKLAAKKAPAKKAAAKKPASKK